MLFKERGAGSGAQVQVEGAGNKQFGDGGRMKQAIQHDVRRGRRGGA